MPLNMAQQRPASPNMASLVSVVRGGNLDTEKSEVAVDTSTHVEATEHRLDNRGQETLLHTITEPRVPLPELLWDDVAIGGLLGIGTFSSVNKVKLLKVISSNAEDGSTARTLLHKNKEYAVKRLQPAVRKDEKARVYAAKDLMFEATILAQLPAHEHIIQLHAVSFNFWNSSDSDGQGFLVLDHLVETLHFRLIRLKARLKANPIPRGTLFFNRSARQLQRRDQQSRITNIALGVARGMKFLHSHRIIYRDLKPANVGFDEHDNVRIMDFGLSRVQANGETERRLTGGTGAARYMAPEVARFDHYSFACDVHAFAILLWEICALERPYASIGSIPTLFKKAVLGNIRPPMGKIASPTVKELLKYSWHPDQNSRPYFAFIVMQLELESTTSLA